MRQREIDALVDELVAADITGIGFGIDLFQNLCGDPHGDNLLLRLSGNKFLQNTHLPFLKIIFDMV